jgi:hypothetical protein
VLNGWNQADTLDDYCDLFLTSLISSLVNMTVNVTIGTFLKDTKYIGISGEPIGFILGNAIASDFTDFIDSTIGAVVYARWNEKNKITEFVTNSKVEYALEKAWKGEAMMKEYYDFGRPFNFISTNQEKPFRFSFKYEHADSGTKTFIFDNYTREHFKHKELFKNEFEALLRRLPESGFRIQTQDMNRAKEVAYNFLSGEFSKEEILNLAHSKREVMYALTTFAPYALKGDDEIPSDFNANTYSDTYIQKRVDMFYNYWNDLRAIDISYQDIDSNIHMLPAIFIAPPAFLINVGQVIFGSDGGNGDNLTIITDSLNLNYIFGNDGDDTIKVKGDIINLIYDGINYIEGGLGSDTIITGTGNDTIYTNANIDTQYDTEDNSVTNTVIAGRGSDKIYGSQGRDIVYSDDKENDGNNSTFYRLNYNNEIYHQNY